MGGTVCTGDELGLGYEGVNLKDKTVCRRIKTIERLVTHLFEKRILLVRSPPMVGKTALAQLLEDYLLNSNEGHKDRIFRVSLLWMNEGKGNGFVFGDEFEDLMCISWNGFLRTGGR